MKCLLVSCCLLLSCLLTPVFGQGARPTNFEEDYYKALEKIKLLEERLQHVNLENEALRKENQLLKQHENPQSKAALPAAGKPVAPKAPRTKPVEIQATFPIGKSLNLRSLGGPAVWLEIAYVSKRQVNLQIGYAEFLNVNLKGDRTLIYQDSATGDEVYLANNVAPAGMANLVFIMQPTDESLPKAP